MEVGELGERMWRARGARKRKRSVTVQERGDGGSEKGCRGTAVMFAAARRVNLDQK